MKVKRILLKSFSKRINNLVRSFKLTANKIFVIMFSFFETFLVSKISKPCVKAFLNNRSNSFLANILAIILGKHSLRVFTTEKISQTNIIELYESFDKKFLYDNFIVYGLLTHFYLETQNFEKLQKLLQNAIPYHINNDNKKSVKKLVTLLEHLYCTDQFLFNFGRFSLTSSKICMLNFYIEKLLSSCVKEFKFTKLHKSVFLGYAKFIIHQDDLYGIDIISNILEKIEKSSEITYGRQICYLLINNTITTEEQMQKRVALSKLYAKKFKSILENEFFNQSQSELLKPINIQLLYNIILLSDITNDRLEVTRYHSLLLESLIFNFKALSLVQMRCLINLILRMQYLKQDNSGIYLLRLKKYFFNLVNGDSTKKIHHIKLGCIFFTFLLKQKDFDYVFNKIPEIFYDYQFLKSCSDFCMRVENVAEGINLVEKAIKILEYQMFFGKINPSMFLKYREFKGDLGRKKFYKHSAEILRTVVQPQNPKRVLFVVSNDHQSALAMGIPIFCELRKKGCAVIYLGQGVLPFESTGNENIDKFHGIIGHTYDYLRDEYCSNNFLYKDWKIDWQNKKVLCEGINSYQGILEYLANRYRRLRIDVNNKIINTFYQTQLRKAYKAFRVCEMIYDDVAAKGIEVSFFAVSAQTNPAYVFKEFCAFKGKDKGMNFYFALNGYENYYTNLGTKISGTLAIANMTENYQRRSPLIAVRKDFEEWIKKTGNTTLKKCEKEINNWLKKDRVGNQGIISPEAKIVWQKVVDNRASGKKIIVVYGKVLCDLGVPYDGGAAHKDMYDWINHTIECARGSNSLVLVKPHPHEKKPEISRYLTEYLVDLIDVEVPQNVILLDNNWFSNYQLTEIVDLAVLWNGTSCLELGAKNIPVVMCAYFGQFDYPVDFYYPKNKKDYFNIIQGKKVIKPIMGNDSKCKLLLKYLKEELSVEYRYVPRAATNDPVGTPYWIEEDLKKYYNDSDNNIKTLAKKFF
ncbi:MAG: hypothetical protein AB8B68_04435 [Rickettsiaceae bacterium]